MILLRLLEANHTSEAAFIGSRINDFCPTIWYSLGEEEWKRKSVFRDLILLISNFYTILEALEKHSVEKGKIFKMKLSCGSSVKL